MTFCAETLIFEETLMQKLILLYWGTVLLMHMSCKYYPEELRLHDRHIGRNNFMWRKSDLFMVLAIVWMTCFSFLRNHYNDTWTYRVHFAQAETVGEFVANGGLLDLTGHPLSTLSRNFIRELTDNYHIYFFVPAVLSSFAVVKLCKQFSVNPAFSLLIFYSIGTYAMYMAALKQCFAVFFLLMALPYAVEKKYVRFYLLLFLAILFHTHAFLFAIVPFLTEKPWGKITWLLLAATLFAMATYDVTLGAFMEYAQSVGALVDEGELFDGHSINILRVLVYWIPPLFALVFRRRLFSDSSPMENLFVNMSIASAFILTIGLIQAANLFARMAGYFEIATIVALPWMLYKCFTPQSANLLTLCASGLYFVYFWYENAINRGFDSDYVAISLWQFFLGLFS